jgi:DNA topoisomerase-1
MGKSLVIVESPAKAKTIKKYLGNAYDVEASSGHIVDLPSNKLGVDIENDFKPHYVVIADKKKYLANLKKAAKDADRVYLASDPDREGEAIAWHIVDQLRIHDRAYRVLIHEITENAVKEAVKNPHALSREKFEAQQARRILDRLVGYKVSPILWKKVRRGLSAGRVQSVALRMIVDREREIELFKPEEYWTIEAVLEKLNLTPSAFVAQLVRHRGEKVRIENEEQARAITESLQGKSFGVISVEKKERTRKAPPPFITSTLQQEAAKKLRFSVKKTMSIAQRLYEGVELGDEGPVGLITYMRTDSVRVSEHAIGEARDFIRGRYGPSYLPDKPNVFKKKRSAQDAHEAIRPTSLRYDPDSIKGLLPEDELELYTLIWKRFLASQMTPIVYDQTTAEIEAGECVFRATGSVVKFPGYSVIYTEGKEDEEEKEEEGLLPELTPGEVLRLIELKESQHFTQPPPRFSESSLVKELEEKGIGRPSTYATILSTIQEREYVMKEKGKLKPTFLGMCVADLLSQGFPEIMDVKFTAEMEENLDRIEEGRARWVEILKSFYGGFSERLERAESALKNLRREGIKTDISCELCGSPMIIKWGKNGEFLSCSSYPECKNAKQFKYGEGGEIKIVEKREQEVRDDVICDLCGRPMALRSSRYGKFFGCTGYPECRGIKKIKDVEKVLLEVEKDESIKASAQG